MLILRRLNRPSMFRNQSYNCRVSRCSGSFHNNFNTRDTQTRRRWPTFMSRFLIPLGFLSTIFFLSSQYYYNSFQDTRAKAATSNKSPPPPSESDEDDLIVILHDKDDYGSSQNPRKPFRIHIYRLLPWRTMSRITGWLLSIELPHWSNQVLLSWYIQIYGVNLHEAKKDKVTDYKSLAELFNRELKKEARPINPVTPLVSPCDGKILQFTRIHNDKNSIEAMLPAVKGIVYNAQTFLGISLSSSHHSQLAELERRKLLKALTSKTSSLYCCIIYLAPGDYHRFHSPTSWQVVFRRHFPGELLSVKPSLTKLVPDIFTLNERVIYIGKWNYGFFSMSAVGATNVGSINVYSDKELVTNTRRFRLRTHKPEDRWFNNSAVVETSKDNSTDNDDVENEMKRIFRKGEPFGQFNLGSTIVLIFEAPKAFEKHFVNKVGKRIKMGQTLL